MAGPHRPTTVDPTRSDAVVDTELGSPASSASPTADRTADRTANLTTRLDAVERAVTNGDADFSSLKDLAAIEHRVTEPESTVELLTDRLDEMDAATQVMRGYFGGVHAVSEDVERQTDTVFTKAELLELRLVDEMAPSTPSRSTDAPASETMSRAGRTTNGGNGSGSQRVAETDLGTGAATPSPEPRITPDSGTSTDSRGDSAGRGLAVRLRDALRPASS